VNSAGATLKRGTGSCFHYISLFIALCRAAGIKARYKTFAINCHRAQPSPVDPVWDGVYNTLGYLAAEAKVEAYIDGTWVVAHPAVSAELQAAKGTPITKFGEDSIGIFFDAVRRDDQAFRVAPLWFGRGRKSFSG
jgi:transglutaminase-like putative cysteine protease